MPQITIFNHPKIIINLYHKSAIITNFNQLLYTSGKNICKWLSNHHEFIPFLDLSETESIENALNENGFS